MRHLLLFLLFLAVPVLSVPGAGFAQSGDEEDQQPTASDQVHIPQVINLEQIGKQSRERGLPILMLVSQTECHYCEMLKAEILKPMILSGEYDDRVLIRELSIDAGETVADFNGLVRSSQDVASDYRAWLTPTLLFLDSKGRQLTKKIRGFNTPEMFAFYVDEAIEQAMGRMEMAQR